MSVVTTVVDDVEKFAGEVESIISALIPLPLQEQLIIDAVPREVEGLVVNLAAHIIPLLEAIEPELQLAVTLGVASNVATPLLNTIKAIISILNTGLVPHPAGSNILRHVPDLMTEVQGFLAATQVVGPAAASVAISKVATGAATVPAPVQNNVTSL